MLLLDINKNVTDDSIREINQYFSFITFIKKKCIQFILKTEANPTNRSLEKVLPNEVGSIHLCH